MNKNYETLEKQLKASLEERSITVTCRKKGEPETKYKVGMYIQKDRSGKQTLVFDFNRC